MEKLTISEAFEKYPYLKRLSNHILFLSEEEIKLLKNSEKIKVGSEEVFSLFLENIIKNEFYFEYASRYFSNSIDRFSVAKILGGDIGSSISYDKNTIINGLESLISSGKLVLSEEELNRFNYLKRQSSFDKFMEKYKENNYTIDIDGSSYSFPTNKLVSFLLIPEDQFSILCSNNDIKIINGVRKEYYFYAAVSFLREINAFKNYIMPDILVKRYEQINSSSVIDIEFINKHLSTIDTKYKNVHIDEELEHAILDQMPDDLNDLEKAIYIYIKMCKLLTYDEEYYAVHQEGVAARKHESIEHLSSINLKNNAVVCFEFNMIYSKLLNKIGINFASDYMGGMDEEYYGVGHANLEFRYDKFIVLADSVTSILYGDIMQAKLNQSLRGLYCTNINENTKKEFKEQLLKVYKIVAKQENENINVEKVGEAQPLEELLEEYSKVTDNIKDINLNERLSIMIRKVNSTKMVGIDSLSYVVQLRRILFSDDQKKNNIRVSIVSNSDTKDDKVASACAIVALNDLDFKEHPNQNIYYYFVPNHELIPISKGELQSRFDDGLLRYVEKDDPKIPGILESEVIKK